MNMVDLYRRIGFVLGLGKLRLANDAGNVQTVQIQLTAAEAPNAPVMLNFGFSSNAPAGSDAVYICLGGDRSKTVVISTNHPGSRPRNLPSGASVQFDQGGSQVLLNNDGTILLKPSGDTVNVMGNIVATGEITAMSGGAAIKLSAHTHGGVAAGIAHTDPPDLGS